MPERRDYFRGLIEAVAATLARVRSRRNEGDVSGARQELQVAITDALGAAAGLAPVLDSRSATDLLGDMRRAEAWGTLLADDAELLRLLDRPTEADATDRRALEVLLEARLRGHALGADSAAALQSLVQRVPPSSLQPRYRHATVGQSDEQ